ncbi:hypothetical protein JCM14036_01300 [Desulfotomaculum defluvii]
MLSKKKLVTGVSTLVLGISMVGAAYALPITNAPIQPENTKTPNSTVNMQQSSDTVDGAKTVDQMMQTDTSKTMPSGQVMNQQPIDPQIQQQMSSWMQQNHQQMSQNHNEMLQNHRAMSGSMMSSQHMGNGHMGFQR